MKFFKGLLVFLLIAVILGGVGYIGYSFLFMNHSGHNVDSTQAQQTGDTSTAANQNQNQQSMAGMPGMQQGSTNSQPQQNNNNQQQGNNQIALNQSNIILQNKDKLGKSMASINEALRLMTVDPYAPSSSNNTAVAGMNNMQPAQQQVQQPAQQAGNVPAAGTQGNTTINIYPQNNNTVNVVPQANGSQPNTQAGAMPQTGVMQNMGTTYDANKMEQLHAGLYKIAVGKALLDQLNSELISQAEFANSNVQNPIQYYSNQYNLTVQNKNKLSQAQTYINEAANLVNINPYISANGLVYDKDRMNQLHQSIQKMAEGVASLNLLSDDFTKQTIFIANTVQNLINNANSNNVMPPMNMSSGLFGGLFDNISISSVVNIVLILFVIGLILGILGFIFSLFKPERQKTEYRGNDLL